MRSTEASVAESAKRLESCEVVEGYELIGGDCDDASAEVNPGATEICDAIDNNCDGSTDEGMTDTETYRVRVIDQGLEFDRNGFSYVWEKCGTGANALADARSEPALRRPALFGCSLGVASNFKSDSLTMS